MTLAVGCAVLLSLNLLWGNDPERFDSTRIPDSADSLSSSASEAGWCEERRWVMGTQLRVVIASDFGEIREAMDAAFDEAKRWDALLSNYDPASPLSQINAIAGEFVPVPEDLFRYLERAKRDAERTGGIFDITIGPLMDTFQTGPTDMNALTEILTKVGIHQLEIEAGENGYRARLTQPGMALDPGGDGKGVAVDAMVKKLREVGVKRAFLDFGGSTYFGLGAPPMAEGWAVAISGTDGKILGTILLKDRALSVSASLLRDLGTVEDDSEDQLMTHIVNPRTGALITDPRTAVVVSPSGVDAEVLSTVLVVTGERGLRFCYKFRDAVAAVFEPDKEPVTWGEIERYYDPPDRGK